MVADPDAGRTAIGRFVGALGRSINLEPEDDERPFRTHRGETVGAGAEAVDTLRIGDDLVETLPEGANRMSANGTAEWLEFRIATPGQPTASCAARSLTDRPRRRHDGLQGAYTINARDRATMSRARERDRIGILPASLPRFRAIRGAQAVLANRPGAGWIAADPFGAVAGNIVDLMGQSSRSRPDRQFRRYADGGESDGFCGLSGPTADRRPPRLLPARSDDGDVLAPLRRWTLSMPGWG